MPELKISEAVDMIGDVYSKILFGYNEDPATTLVGYDGVGESGIDNPEVDQLLCIALNHLILHLFQGQASSFSLIRASLSVCSAISR
jgi:hypothetical protein